MKFLPPSQCVMRNTLLDGVKTKRQYLFGISRRLVYNTILVYSSRFSKYLPKMFQT